MVRHIFAAFRTLMAVVLTAVVTARSSSMTCPNLPGVYPPSETDLPLCGNGVLDAGETCDDGNRVGGDGCNAWCSQFDILTKPCTVAGKNAACPSAQTQPVLSTPAQSQFCALTAVAAAPSGEFLVLADGGALVRMPLYQAATALTLLPASVSYNAYKRFCFVHVLPDNDSVLAHECQAQQVLMVSGGGSSLRTVSQLGGLLAPATAGLAHYEDGVLLVAGLPAQGAFQEGVDSRSCVLLYAITVSTGARRLAGAVPCVAYNVWEGGALFTSFSAEGMVPQSVAPERCLPQMSSTDCYVVRMVRGDMQRMVAYLPKAGGSDARYTVHTNPTVNVLGSPSRTLSADRSITYTLTGACLSAQSNFMTRAGRTPPAVTLGNVCKLVGDHGWSCSTPLNSPFNTDVVSSPYLLPTGLTSRHTHAQLVSIFSAPLSNSSLPPAGMPLYSQILRNALSGAAPVAMAEIPTTRDLVYITATSVGLISSKGIVLNDPYNPGYCIPTKLIQCPAGMYGSVGGPCRSCSAEANDGTSIAAQVQCLGQAPTPGDEDTNTTRRRLLSTSMQSPPYVSTTHVVSQNMQKTHFDTLAAYIMLKKGFACPVAEDSSLTPPLQFNMAADAVLAGSASSGSAAEQQVVEALIAAAENLTQLELSMPVQDEYTVTWSTQHLGLLNLASRTRVALSVNDTYMQAMCPAGALVARANGSIAGLAEALSVCDNLINKPISRVWMPCAAEALLAWWGDAEGAAGARRLLQAPQQGAKPVVVEQSTATLYSDTAIVYYDSRNAPAPPVVPPERREGAATAAGPSLIIVVGAVAGVVGALLLVGALYWCLRRKPSRGVKVM